VWFENPAHDFLTRILHRKNAHGSLSLAARIEGEPDGKTRGRDFHLQPMKKDGFLQKEICGGAPRFT
jgi:hypothetical protein